MGNAAGDPCGGPIGSVTGNERVVRDRANDDLFGTDMVFRDGLLQDASGDYLLSEGIDNLRQAVYRRIYTSPGEHKYRPGYGVGARDYVKRSMTATNIDRLKNAIRTQLPQDPRIDRVTDVTVAEHDLGDGRSGLSVFVSVQAGGRAQSLGPFTFSKGQ